MDSHTLSFPKVLILIQPFNQKAGGGITLSNLFRQWPKEKLAVAALGSLVDSDTKFDICDHYYVLGSEEQVWKFPLNLIKRRIKSGPLKFENFKNSERLPQRNNFRAKISSDFVMPLIKWLGLFEFLYEINLSDPLKKWIDAFNPDIIYAQAHTRGRVLFCNKIQEFTGYPMAFHMMDDWLKMVRQESIIGEFWEKKSTEDFKEMLDRCKLHFSISDLMGLEYQRRFNIPFTTFHNPIELDFWKRGQRSKYSPCKYPIVLYAGRVGLGIDDSLESMAKAIDSINEQKGMFIRFVLQVGIQPSWIESYKCTEYRKPVPYQDLPVRFGEADILYLPYDFNVKSISFIKFSMPTKVSEYMISGTPILIFAPQNTALVTYAEEYKWAKVVTENKFDSLKIALYELLMNENLRKEIALKAVEVAEKRHDASVVRENFRKQLGTLVQPSAV